MEYTKVEKLEVVGLRSSSGAGVVLTHNSCPSVLGVSVWNRFF